MHGRRLATTDEIIAIASPDSDEPLERLRNWADERDVGFAAVGVGDDVGDVYEESRATLGVTIGGDGTFLEGIKTFAPRNIPILGVNAGTLAFLARVEIENLEAALDEVLRGRATVDSRQQVRVETSGLRATGINDVMIQHVPPENPFERKVTRLEVFADGEYVGEFEGSGLAVSTPTGSTGISLSAEGPLHYPVNNHTLQIVPLHTHRMGVRPMVVAPTTDLEIVTRGTASVLVDGGRAHNVLSAGTVIEVTGAERRAHVVRTSYDDPYFTAITDKLGWGARDVDDPGPRELLDGQPTIGERDPTIVERARDIAIEAARSAGEPLRELHGQIEGVEYKTDKSDIVTEADHQADRIIKTVVENEFPDHSIFSEESAYVDGDSAYEWVIDPLDGTGNFAHGNPNYSISIALLCDGVPVMGVVHVPETGEMFHAIADEEEAYEGETRIETTDRDALDESMLLSGYDPDGSFLAHYYAEARGVRRLGSAALNLCYLASGSADAVWEYDTYPWDVAAGVVIARTAGATITDETGDTYTLEFDADGRKGLLASNGPLHPAMLVHLEREDAGLADLADD
ncbi:NAD(+)/NADH kinase [Natrarchaeobaculum aegyptiacum]|uniref:NAD kinase n=1 Tax=Natrarchaeobaculum aegyptiacum TaxID=745377 RepID=A0A2Z2HSZ0_9EURY|nr:inositol monophosphatase family protein [Natrarchaeobaculum aegyptiacum]ARS90341.1 inositol monophosphatase [Natrarchaeobaculum aegyptiacum]